MTDEQFAEILKGLPKDTIPKIATILYPHCSCTPAMPDARRIYAFVVEPLEKALSKAEADKAVLVEALEKLARLGNGDNYGNSDGNCIAQAALAKVKGEALSAGDVAHAVQAWLHDSDGIIDQKKTIKSIHRLITEGCPLRGEDCYGEACAECVFVATIIYNAHIQPLACILTRHGVESARFMRRAEADKAVLVEALEKLMKAYEMLLPAVGKISVPDYALLNDAPCQARAVLAKVKEQQ